MTFFAGSDSGQQDVRRSLTRSCVRMALDAFHKLVRVMIENRVREPSRRDIRFGNRGQGRVRRERHGVAFRTGLPPKQLFGFRHAHRDPFLRSEHSRGGSCRLLRKVSVRCRHAKLRRMARNVLLKLLKKKRMNYSGSVVRNLIRKARIKSQSMARAAMFCVSDRDHVGAADLLRRWNILRVRLRACG